jgi:RNA polymerase sigma-70 factor (ECF subfamily)
LIQKYRSRLIEGLRLTGRTVDEIEDIVSHAFITAFEKMDRFRGEASFYTWLYRIAMNEAYEVTRKGGAVSIDALTRYDDSKIPDVLMEKNPVFDGTVEQLDRTRLAEVLPQVPELYRELVELYFFKELSYQAIADHLSIPIGTVMSRLHTGRQMLKDLWHRPAPVP